MTPVAAAGPHRVLVWGTGFVGKMVIREILGHPDFELAGVLVHDPAKDGMDVGVLVGAEPVGMRATTDVDAALAGDADAVAYYGPTAALTRENLANMSAALRAGKDVVATAMTPFVYPPACPSGLTDPIAEACRAGGTSCFTTGIDPGFANDLLPLTLMGVCGRVDRVRVSEILDYSTYTGDYSPMGFGEPPGYRALLEEPEILIFAWGHTVYLMADAIGAALQSVDTVYEKWMAPEPITFPFGVIEAGRCAAVRFEIRGIVDGEPRLVLEHCNRITRAAAPHWPRPASVPDDAYRVEIEGSPNIVQETTFRSAVGGDANAGGCLATGMRALNAIPAVRAAAPGLLSALDLPLVPGHGVMR